MAGEWSFDGARFDFVYQDRQTPIWKPDVDATERRLIGTERVERTWRSTRWVLAGDGFIEPDDLAAASFATLMNRFAHSTLGTLSDGVSTWPAVLITFDVVPLYNGTAGYRGAMTFLRPEG